MNELGPEARDILDAGRAGDEPTAGDRTRMRASILRAIAAGGAIGAASAAAETSAAAGLKAGALSAWKLVAGLFVAGVVAGAGAGLVTGRSGEAPPSTTGVVSVAAAPAAPPAGHSPGAAPAAPSVLPEASPAPRPAAAPAAPRPAATLAAGEAPGAPPPPGDTLAAELQGLREAHSAMQGGDPARALALLDEQQAGGSALREERAAARVLALCRIGRVGEGRAAAARFLEESPRSPLADRVRGACPARETR
jgi:hypothetical protein